MTSARPNPRRLPSPTAFALAVLFAVPAAHAQGAVDPIPASVLRPYLIRESEPSTPPERTPARFESVAPQPRDLSWLGGAVQYEAPREAVNGTYTRPKIAVGVPSESLKEWMKSAGFNAERCLLPMVRARARVSPDGDANGTLWLHARCSFQ
jgi:hypothetical protein